MINAQIAANAPPSLLQALHERVPDGLAIRIVGGKGAPEKADAPHAFARLRHSRQRPCCRRAGEKRDEVAALESHSMTSSARPSSVIGTVSPSALAVLRLMISSTFVACWTGKSAGFSPLRTRPV